jgi:membrane-associated protease RseP (regulator of RpoE activity)
MITCSQLDHLYRYPEVMWATPASGRWVVLCDALRNVWLRGGTDYLRTSKYSETLNGIRAFAGITFTFGGTGASSDQKGPSQHSQPQRTTDAGMNIAPLGITVTAGENTGAKIVDVATNGVAGKAGLHSGDVINAVDGTSVRTPMELAAQLASRGGNKVRLGYLLHGQWQTWIYVQL